MNRFHSILVVNGMKAPHCVTVVGMELVPRKLATSILQIERLSTSQNQLFTQAIDNILNGNLVGVVFLGTRFHGF